MMKTVPLHMMEIDKNVLSIRCPERYVLQRIIEHLDKMPEVVSHSKILRGPAIWFRAETDENFIKVKDTLLGGLVPLFLAEAAARPPLFVRYFWLVWAILVGLTVAGDVAMRIINSTEGTIHSYIAGFVAILLSLYNYKRIQSETEDRIRSVHEIFLEAMKDKAKE